MIKIKFGTDGWRAIIAKDFIVENVARVAFATGKWLSSKSESPSIVVGHDTRFAGKLFAETAAKVFASMGIKVYISEEFVSTPMVSLGVKLLKADMGIVITASHNSPEYNGFKLKGKHGGPLLEEDVRDIELMIPESNDIYLDLLKWHNFIEYGLVQYVDLETMYYDYACQHFDIDSIKQSKFKFAFEAMYGSGQNVFKRLFSEVPSLHCDDNPTFKGVAPEPLLRNLGEFSEFIKSQKNIDCGLAVDGDADRIALFDGEGNYIDSHHIMLLLIYYLAKIKGLDGKVVTGFSSTVKIDTLCDHLNLKVQRVKIGFKDICKVMLKENVLLGGEESGGIAIKTYLPERDGIWMGLTIWQFMVETGKTLNELINEVYSITGEFAFERSDLKIEENTKKKILEKCKKAEYSSFGKYKIQRIENIDGFKYYFSETEWGMIRVSGTEPVLRTYAEAATKEKAKDILDSIYQTIMSV